MRVDENLKPRVFIDLSMDVVFANGLLRAMAQVCVGHAHLLGDAQ